jgi:DsbC/DsbD-like thiol-disulfide interchange protein
MDTAGLTPKLTQMLAEVDGGRVEFAPSSGRHQWWWHKPGTTGQGSRVTTDLITLVAMKLVKTPTPRASGTARLTDEGKTAITT